MAENHGASIEVGHVLFLDIVGYSRLLLEEQTECVRQLTEIVLGTRQVQEATNEQLVRLPTGDGMALVFRNSSEEPAQCALEIGQALKLHPELRVRMGIHSGPVSPVIDVTGRSNLAGAGINVAQRVMDCGDAGHILLSQRVADELAQFGRWQPHLHDLGTCTVKHGLRIEVHNLCNGEAGNAGMPQKFLRARRRRRITALVAVLLLGLMGAGGALYFHHKSESLTTPAKIPEKSIAVLPFANLSEDKGNAYFAAGIQDEILTRLAHLRDLKVIARTSVEKYESQPHNLAEIGTELGVAHLLEGSVQKRGNQVHVNLQLIKAATGAHVWAQSYDRTLDGAFAVQGEVAQTVANSLKIALLPAQLDQLKRSPTDNPAAYDLYLRGDYALEEARKNSGDYHNAFEPALRDLRQATSADPQFAQAFARLAYAELTKENFGHLDGRTERNPELLASAKQNADRALQLQPDLPEAHLALGRWQQAAQHDRAAALAEYRRALALDPNLSEATSRVASLLVSEGRTEEAIALYRRGLESDPRNYQLLRNLGIAYTMRREYEQAAEVDGRIVALNPADEADAGNLALDLLQSRGDLEGAQKILRDLIAHLPAGQPKGSRLTSMELMLLTLRRDFVGAKKYAEAMPAQNWETDWTRPLTLGEVEHHLGNEEAARGHYRDARAILLAAMAKEPDEPQAHADLALLAAGLGSPEEALREARRAIELEPVTQQARAGLIWLVNLAQVQARLGQREEAIKGLNHLMALPNSGEALAAWQLRLDPVWDPLRGHPAFQKLIAPSAAPRI